MARTRQRLSHLTRFLGPFALFFAAMSLLHDSRGVFTHAFTGITLLTIPWGFHEILRVRSRCSSLAWNTALVVLSFTISACAFEAVIGLVQSPQQSMVMPEEWELREIQAPGPTRTFYWMGALHVLDRDGFRTVTPYEAETGTLRIAFLGDSLTYGFGVEYENAYPSLIKQSLATRVPRLTVYNLGSPGMESQGILDIAQEWLPRLRPHIVVYGICLNDFLPTPHGDYANNMRWQFPFPNVLQAFYTERTLLGRFFAERYDALLRKLGMRDGYFDDIFRDFDTSRKRFAADLRRMNAVGIEISGRPIIAMVVDQHPHVPEAHELARAAEEAAADAGMEVVSTDAYFNEFRHMQRELTVSRWEQHPNAVAHGLFASMLLPAVEKAGPVVCAAQGVDLDTDRGKGLDCAQTLR